ncbi:MAG: Lrp/AsnC family transcriptional regulator [Candidatus Woesearchaeota archaeon]|nr:MAG: Lrp/AsnC family transcriptional regulator [Candidatus Woesearchaeota archaeon]
MENNSEKEGFRGEIKAKPAIIKLDLINRKILYLLGQNARFSSKSIAKALNISREVVAYRIRKLQEEDFLHGFFALINTSRIGFQNNMIYLKLTNTLNYEEFIIALEKKKEVTRLKETAGAYDLQIIFTTRTIEEFDKELDGFLNTYAKNIKEYVILRIIDESYLGLSLFLEQKERKKTIVKETKGTAYQKDFQERKPSSQIFSLDEKDKKILAELQHNARTSLLELSKNVGLSTIAVDHRIKKLIRERVIEATYPLAALSQLNYQWYKVFLQIRNIDQEAFISHLREHDNVLWYMKLVGKWNYQFSVFAQSNIEFHNILNEIRNKYSDNILYYDSLVILNQRKYVQRLE